MLAVKAESDSTVRLEINAVWQQLRARDCGFSDSLLLLVEAAKRITRADGVALALGATTDPEVVVCRASTGEAPAMGAALDSRWGLSGYCFRSGEPVLCNDTSKDPRVRAEVCRSLNLGSLAVVPLRDRRVIGIIEALASTPGAFDEKDLDALCQLADIAVALDRKRRAAVQEPQQTGGQKSIPPGGIHPTLQPSLCWTSGKNAAEMIPRLKSLAHAVRKHSVKTLLAMAAVPTVVAALLLVVAFWTRHSGQQPHLIVGPAAASSLVGSNLRSPQSDIHAPHTSKNSAEPLTAKRVPLHNEKENDDGTNVADEVPALVQPSIASIPDNAVSQDSMSGSFEDQAAEPPPIASLMNDDSTERSDLGTILSEPRTQMPSLLERKGLQGVVPARLIYHTQPVYPVGTVLQQVTVVVQATVGTNGGVKDVHAISGPSAFATSAIAAVKEWRYKPSLLNGQPIEATTLITIKYDPTE
jgi:GAF domain/Gram-negative bacterial TonB protein C-terminal